MEFVKSFIRVAFGVLLIFVGVTLIRHRYPHAKAWGLCFLAVSGFLKESTVLRLLHFRQPGFLPV